MLAFSYKVLEFLPFTIALLCCVSGEIVDLSHPYRTGPGVNQSEWPSHQRYTSTVVIAGPLKPGVPWVALSDITLSEHIGTHIDAPYHFDPNGRHVHEIPLADLVGPIVVIDIRDRANNNPDAETTVQDLTDWETEHGRIPDRAFILLLSGWGHRFGNNDAFIGDYADNSTWHFPGFSEASVNWLLTNRPTFLGLGSEAVSCEPCPNHLRNTNPLPVHIALLNAGKICIECVNSQLEKVPKTGAKVYGLPLKLFNGSGSASRVVAVWGKNEWNWASGSAANIASPVSIMLLLVMWLLMRTSM